MEYSNMDVTITDEELEELLRDLPRILTDLQRSVQNANEDQ